LENKRVQPESGAGGIGGERRWLPTDTYLLFVDVMGVKSECIYLFNM
jgi:hypothetical protein